MGKGCKMAAEKGYGVLPNIRGQRGAANKPSNQVRRWPVKSNPTGETGATYVQLNPFNGTTRSEDECQ